MILALVVLIAALAVASYEMFRRRGLEPRNRDPIETSDPPPHLLNDDPAHGDGDADGDGGG